MRYRRAARRVVYAGAFAAASLTSSCQYTIQAPDPNVDTIVRTRFAGTVSVVNHSDGTEPLCPRSTLLCITGLRSGFDRALPRVLGQFFREVVQADADYVADLDVESLTAEAARNANLFVLRWHLVVRGRAGNVLIDVHREASKWMSYGIDQANTGVSALESEVLVGVADVVDQLRREP